MMMLYSWFVCLEDRDMWKAKEEFQAEQLAELLYETCAKSYQYGSPWSAHQFIEDIQQKHSMYIVLLADSQLIGFISVQTILDEMEVTHCVVSKEHQGQGYAKKLLEKLFQYAEEKAISRIFLEVRQMHQKAQTLYQSMGFEPYYTRKQYYHHPIEDAVLMKREFSKEECYK